ncbi:hypothetical protein HFP57_11010 [Parasphingopyxis algicola]|uniref:hypothetical protein n=1 Tax=Parasphingopyxis algicola TaxID=2026624 RepID=UPI0015A2FA1C|nr:hypothetical protein [Parasphingopyxis algicola]QLC25496.1 hypothetical protein HFP57_11010 [Parasphingopyxis algicola]
MKHVLPVIVLSGICCVTPVYAQPADDEPAENAVMETEIDPSQRVRCQTRRVTGSNARRIRTCLTVAEWAELARRGNRDARRVVDQSTRDSINRNLDPGT